MKGHARSRGSAFALRRLAGWIAAAGLAWAAAAGAQDLTPAQQLWVNSYSAEEAGDYARALGYVRSIVEGGGDYYMANLRAGWLHYLNKDYEKALAAYRKAAGLSPGAVSPLIGQMNCLEAKGSRDDALKVGKSVLAIDPMNVTANGRLAALYYAGGDYATAAAYYLKLCSLYPEDLASAASLAWSYFKQGRVQEAQTIFDNILVVSPNHRSAKEGFAACLVPAAPAGGTARKAGGPEAEKTKTGKEP